MTNKLILAAALVAGIFLFDSTAPTASAFGLCRRGYAAAYTPYYGGYSSGYYGGYSGYSGYGGYAPSYSSSYYARPAVPYYGYSFSGYTPYNYSAGYGSYASYSPSYGYGFGY